MSVDGSVASEVIWEFVPKPLPPIIRWIIRYPVQRVRIDETQIWFEGAGVHDTYPNRDLQGKLVYRERPPKRRTEPVPLADVLRVAVYPVRGGIIGGSGGSGGSRAFYTVVDLWRQNDARTVATFVRAAGLQPADERQLSDAVRDHVGGLWSEPPGHEIFLSLDEKRLRDWYANG